MRRSNNLKSIFVGEKQGSSASPAFDGIANMGEAR
jgi:hypothetical protein